MWSGEGGRTHDLHDEGGGGCSDVYLLLQCARTSSDSADNLLGSHDGVGVRMVMGEFAISGANRVVR